MLNNDGLERYFSEHNLAAAARDYIRRTRDSEPSRVVGQRAHKNVCTWFASRKMGRTIQSESRTAEQRYVHEYEFDEDVLEYWDQPPTTSIIRTDKCGVLRPGPYTPDFLVLYKSGPRIEEVKTDQQLHKLTSTNPTDWLRADGGFQYRPAVEKFLEFGLPFSVRCTSSLNAIRNANIQLLLMARGRARTWDDRLRMAAITALTKFAWLTLDELSKSLFTEDLTPFFHMIDDRVLFVAFDEELLSLPKSVWVASTPELAAESLKLRRDAVSGFEQTGFDSVSVGTVPTAIDANSTLAKHDRLLRGTNGRSERRWKKIVREGEKQGVSTFYALLSRSYQRGNRNPKLDKSVIAFARDFVAARFARPERPLLASAYAEYRDQAKTAMPNFDPVSRTTLRRYIREADPTEVAAGRGGRRAANAAACPAPIDKRELKPELPFVFAVVDHYLCDIETVIADAVDRTFTARPWLTALVDVATGALLAVWLSYRTPSVRSVGMIIRLCQRRHGRLPKMILMDRGPEFESVYCLALLAHLAVDRVLRPTADPRYGGEGERHFNLFRTRFLTLRPGNTAAYFESRAVSTTHSPQRTARLSLEELWSDLMDYIDWHNNSLLGNQSESPAIAITNAISRMPFLGVKAEDNAEFRVATAIDVRNYTVDPARGIHIDDNARYWAPQLTEITGKRKKPEVRIDPEDPYVVYARISDRWVPCFAQGGDTFRTMDPVKRWAQAARLLDGRVIRENAKLVASEKLAKSISDSDAKREAKPQPCEVVPKPSVPLQSRSRSAALSAIFRIPSTDAVTKNWGGV